MQHGSLIRPLRGSTSLALALAALAMGLAGCGDAPITSEPVITEPPRLPTNLAEGWNEIKPGGDTICSRGSEYAYFVSPGKVNRVVIDFIGGGACWNALTCGIADAIFTDSVDGVRERIEDPDTENHNGLYDRLNPDNPFKDWYHVVIPYCTGDVHWGNNEKTYDEGTAEPVTIKHRGAVNSRAVLDWVYENFSAPEHVLVTGCSAGSYGSAMWAPHIMDHYKGARVTQFGDSGAGIITEEFFRDSFPSWKAEGAFPTFIPELDPSKVDLLELKMTDLYAAVGNHFPDHRVSQYNTTFDENQTFYFQAMGGGTAEDWSVQMLASIEAIEGRAPNFSSFIPTGEQHCIVPYDNFYTVNVGGRRLVDWLRELVDQSPPESLACTGDCTAPTP